MSHLMFIGEIIPEPSVIYKKPTNNVGGWSYAAEPEAEDSKFYEFEGEWFYVVKDRNELISLRDQGSWETSTNPNQLVSITDKDSITKSIPMNNLITTRLNNMNYVFSYSESNQYIGNWDTGNVKNMNMMFNGSYYFNQDIGNWDVSSVTHMSYMFAESPFNQDIGNWDVSNVDRMNNMFAESPFNQDIGNWNVSNVWFMNTMFSNNNIFNQDLSSWCVSSVIDYTGFDDGASSWVLPKPNFDNPPC